MNWSKIRAAIYALSVAACMGLVYAAVAMGWATYDAGTGLVDIKPFHAGEVVAAVLSWLGTAGLAFIALVKGWGVKG